MPNRKPLNSRAQAGLFAVILAAVMTAKQSCSMITPQLDPEFNASGEFPGGPGFLIYDPIFSFVSPLFFSVQDSVADDTGNRYIAGGVLSEGLVPAIRSFAAKLSPSGTIQFLTVLPRLVQDTLSSEIARGVTLNSSGAIFLCGLAVVPPLPNTGKVIAARLEPDGTFAWGKEYPSIASKPIEGAGNCDVNAKGELVISAFAQDNEQDANANLFVLIADGTDGDLLSLTPITVFGSIFNDLISQGSLGNTDFLIDTDQNYIFGATQAVNGTITGPLAFAAAKINPSGNATIWSSILGPIGSTIDQNLLGRVAIDSDSNVILLGSTPDTIKFVTAKLNPSGMVLWATALQAPFGSTGSADIARAVAVNTISNEISLVGGTDALGSERFATVLLNPSGMIVWTSVLPPFVTGQADQAETISFATSPIAPQGSFFSVGNADLEFGGFGSLLGIAQLSTTGTTLSQQAYALTAAVERQTVAINTNVATTDINMIVTPIGFFSGGNTLQLAIAQFSPTGSLNWLTPISNARLNISNDYAPRTIVDSSSFSITAFEQPDAGINHFAAFRVNNSGIVSWSMGYPDLFGTGLASTATDVGLCPDNNYVLGGFFSRQQNPDLNSFATMKVSAVNGNIIWKTGIIAPFGSTSSSDTSTTINLDQGGNIYLAGSTQSQTLDTFWAALRLSASGQTLNWTAVLPVTGTIFDSILNNGELLVAGGQGVSGDFSPLLARIRTTDGNLIGIVPIMPPNGMTNAVIASLATDTEQNLYILISSDQASTVLKLSDTFLPLWTLELPVIPSSINSLAGIKVDSEGNVITGIPVNTSIFELQATLTKIQQITPPPLSPLLALPFITVSAA